MNDFWLDQTLRSKAQRGDLVFAVLGAGNGGLAMAGHLALRRHRVRLYNRTAAHLEAVRWHGGIQLRGELQGFAPLSIVTADLAEAVAGADVVLVVTPATAHRSLATGLAPVLEPGQLIVLNPGRTGGALEFVHVLSSLRPGLPVVVAETQTFLYAARASGNTATVHRIKDAVPFATLPSYWIPAALAVLTEAFPAFEAGTNVLVTSLENIGAVFHPALTLLNAGWIEASGGAFEYYHEGITPAVAAVLEAIDDERMRIAAALGVRCHSALEWLYRSYGSSGKGLYEAIRSTAAYRGIRAPSTVDHRYVWEDVPMSLVPLASFGAALGIGTPTIDLIIDLGCRMLDRDLRAEGRTLASLGLAGVSVRDLTQLVAGSPSRSLP